MLVISSNVNEPMLVGRALVHFRSIDGPARKMKVCIDAPSDVRVLRWDALKKWLTKLDFVQTGFADGSLSLWMRGHAELPLARAVELALTLNPEADAI